MKFFVTGGAGYIGSHFVAHALRGGHTCVVFDNLERGHAAAVPEGVLLVRGDMRDQGVLEETLWQTQPDAVLHYAAYALVAESVANPGMYDENNVGGTRNLLEAMLAVDASYPLVFSSSCAVFGQPDTVPIGEDAPKAPASPYGESKLACEQLIEQYCQRHSMKACALRYFNACGADASGDIGEHHEPETHLIPNCFKACVEDQPMTVFGSDYPTKDGTCVRDYIHVTDLAQAHILAAEALMKKDGAHFQALNLGSGVGYTNLEILAAVEKVVEKPVKKIMGERRPGDPAALYADTSLAKEVLGFEPRYSDLSTIMQSAWQWHSRHPGGYL